MFMIWVGRIAMNYRTSIFVFIVKYMGFIIMPILIFPIIIISFTNGSIGLGIYGFFSVIVFLFISLRMQPIKIVDGNFYGINLIKWHLIDIDKMDIIKLFSGNILVRQNDRGILSKYNFISIGFGKDYNVLREICLQKGIHTNELLLKPDILCSSTFTYIYKYGCLLHSIPILAIAVVQLLFDDIIIFESSHGREADIVILIITFIIFFNAYRKTLIFMIKEGEIYVKRHFIWRQISKESIKIERIRSNLLKVNIEDDNFRCKRCNVSHFGNNDYIIREIITNNREL